MRFIKPKWLAFSLLLLTAGLTALKASAIVDPSSQQSLDAISFSQLPPADTGGEVQIPNGPIVRWERGQTPSDYLPLGVIIDSLGVGDMTLNDIGDVADFEPGNLRLSDLELMEWQTIEHLEKAVPHLGDYKVSDVKPVSEALGEEYSESLISDLPKKALSKTLLVDRFETYTVNDIPNLPNTAIDRFNQAERSTIYGVPGVEDIPMGQFPTPVQAPFWAKVDIVYGHRETTRQDSITGSVQAESWSVPCESPCSYLEMTNAITSSGNLSKFAYHGKQYIAGDFQKVKGGWAIEESNWMGGYEPTGQLPFGELAKVSIADLTEQKGTGQLRLNFRYCERSFGVTKSCTPYGVQNGLVSTPLMSFQEKGIIPVMALTGSPANGSDPSKPDDAEVDISDPRKGERGSEAPIQGASIPRTGPSQQSSSSSAPPSEEDSSSQASSQASTQEGEPKECNNSPPVRPVADYPVTSSYGQRPRPCTTCSDFHSGIDLGTPMQTELKAAESGTVVASEVWGPNGLYTKVETCDGYTYAYLHLTEALFKPGDVVEKGQTIAHSGGVGPLAGASTGPHLHVHVWKNGAVIDPAEWILF